MGPARTAKTLLKLNQADGFDCMSCAWPDPDPDHRHTAEFCENGAKAVAEEADQGPRRPGVLRRALASPTCASAVRVLARQAGPDHRADGAARGGDALRADQLGRRVRADRRARCAAWPAPTRRCSTPPAGPPTRPRSATSCSPAPTARTTCRTARTCATSRPRSRCQEVIGIGKASVAYQDVLRRQADRDHGPEPGHQPPADADRPGEGEAERREDPRDQPAPRGRADQVQEPADARAASAASAPSSPTCTCRSGSTATWR